jgi:hypothetical protein
MLFTAYYGAPYSKVESLFGMYKEKYGTNEQVREDGLAAQMQVQQNDTFDLDSPLSNLTKLMQVVVRAQVLSERGEVRTDLSKRKKGAAAYKTQSRLEHRDVTLTKARAEFARALIEFGVEMPTVAAFQALLDSTASKKEKDQQADTIYHAIVEGWAYKKGECVKHSSVAGTKCGMGCTHNRTDGMVHWHEHAMKLLTEAVATRELLLLVHPCLQSC